MALIGSILGDIAGSRYEYYKPPGFNHETVELFSDKSFFTDDTVMTLATKKAIEQENNFKQCYQYLGRSYPDAGYGGMFDSWIRDEDPKPYNSFGNGSAMRVSYIGEYFNTEEDVIKYATASAECTHNHPEGIKGAVVTAMCILMGRQCRTKSEIIKYAIRCYPMNNYAYNPNIPLGDIRDKYEYDVTCQGTVPVAIRCFMESYDYESCIRNVLSLNGDADTMACIAGGIAESYYGATGFDNEKILRKYLDDRLYRIVMI